MDGTPQLLTDVKFKQLKRGGYDPDQVDNFLERVSSAVSQLQDKLRQATDRAESADAHIAAARRLQADAEAAADRARAALAQGGGSKAGTGGADDGDQVKKVLVLAQRVADQAVEEANSTATGTVADARAKAVNLLAEAEQERDRMLTTARAKADAIAEGRVQELQEQVTELESARVDLQNDVDVLHGHLDGERARLHKRLAAIAAILDDPDGLAVSDAPRLRNPMIPDLGPHADADAVADAVPVPVAGAVAGADADMGRRDGDGEVGDGQEGVDDPAESGVDDTVDTLTVAVPAGPYSVDPADPVAVISIGSEADLPGDDLEGDATIDLTTERLFGDDDGIDDGGPATELFVPSATATAPEPQAQAGDSPLGEPDAAADAAMRAFFEQDLDEVPESAKPRFSRRR